MSGVRVELDRWTAKPFSLEVEALIQPFHVRLNYCRRQDEGKFPWKWYAWSAADKFTAYVNATTQDILDELVLSHPILTTLAPLYGYEARDVV